jgi:hypothetical protein
VVNVAPIVVTTFAGGTVIVPVYPPETGPNDPVWDCVVLVVTEPDELETGVGVGVGTPPPPPPPGTLPPPPPPHAANAADKRTTANAGRTRSSNFMPS